MDAGAKGERRKYGVSMTPGGRYLWEYGMFLLYASADYVAERVQCSVFLSNRRTLHVRWGSTDLASAW